MQKLIEEIKTKKEVSMRVVTCLVCVHNSQDSTSRLLTTCARHTGVSLVMEVL